jgi:hypothetical protein
MQIKAQNLKCGKNSRANVWFHPWRLPFLLIILQLGWSACCETPPPQQVPSTAPQAYTVKVDEDKAVLTLATQYYEVQHALKKGGAIASVRLRNGSGTNLVLEPLSVSIQDDGGRVYSDLNDPKPVVTHETKGGRQLVNVTSQLLDPDGHSMGVSVATTYDYRWGYVKIHREFAMPSGGARVRDFCALSAAFAPSLTRYGYREGTTEAEGAPAFSFGSCRWGKLEAPASPVTLAYLPRYLMLAKPDVEGIEWFMSSDLSQWDAQLTDSRGQARFTIAKDAGPKGVRVSISPYFSTNSSLSLSQKLKFDSYLGVPILEGRARKPWFHTSFNRNRGDWVSPQQINTWKANGIQTVHCHNDGNYYDDGLFWRDGSYPPYPDMPAYDKVIAGCHDAGIRVATYFSNKELHPSTPEFRDHSSEWARMNAKGQIQHNFYRGTNEFGAQMCLRSGWLDFLKSSIDRVLVNHRLDGVYYDWNVALLCCNGRHEGLKPGEPGRGHWDIDELVDLMEWTRQRVGPKGMVIIHNTTTPMFCLENLADYIVANEWGYGKWTGNGPELDQLPLEWSLVGARSRGVISYGQLGADSPKRLHRVFALQALLSGVTPWPANEETFEIFRGLANLSDLESFQFRGWRNEAIKLTGTRTASAVYSRPGEATLVVANMSEKPQTITCSLNLERLPFPLKQPASAILSGREELPIEFSQLVTGGVSLPVPGDSALFIHIKEGARTK